MRLKFFITIQLSAVEINQAGDSAASTAFQLRGKGKRKIVRKESSLQGSSCSMWAKGRERRSVHMLGQVS